jgi:very-short-patch-repair endonuclease
MAETGVVRVEGAQITWESTLLAHVLAAGDAAMASHRSAAALWRFDGFRRVGKPELVLPATQRRNRADVIVHRSSDVDLVKAVRIDGIPATPVGRTLLDLGAVVGRQKVLLAVDDARRRKLIDWSQLLDVLLLHARRGRDGVGTLRAILDEHLGEVAKTDSGFERLVMILLAQHGLPRPVLQHEVRFEGRKYRIDLAYPDRHIAIELDGQVHLQREVWERDHIRQIALTNAGWRVLPFTWRQYREDPGWIVREVRKALRRQPTRS